MTDSSQIKENGISVNPDGAEKTGAEKPKTDGGAQDSGKPKETGEKKNEGTARKPSIFGAAGSEASVRVGGGAPREELKSVLLFAATSIAAGYISFLLTPARPAFIPIFSSLAAIVMAVVIFYITKVTVQKLAGRKDMKWIMGNGGAIYLFLWFVTWIIFYNVL